MSVVHTVSCGVSGVCSCCHAVCSESVWPFAQSAGRGRLASSTVLFYRLHVWWVIVTAVYV